MLHESLLYNSRRAGSMYGGSDSSLGNQFSNLESSCLSGIQLFPPIRLPRRGYNAVQEQKKQWGTKFILDGQ